MGIRKGVKTSIQNVVKNAVGVKTVFTYRPKLINQADFPSVVISLPKEKETRLTASAPFGKKDVAFTAQLEISMIDVSNDGAGQLVFDDILDAIDDELRKDPTFGGTVIGATIEFINTVTTPPQLVGGQNVALMALKQFDVRVLATG